MQHAQKRLEATSFVTDVSGKPHDPCNSNNDMLTPMGGNPGNSVAQRHPEAAVEITWRFGCDRIAMAWHSASKSPLLCSACKYIRMDHSARLVCTRHSRGVLLPLPNDHGWQIKFHCVRFASECVASVPVDSDMPQILPQNRTGLSNGLPIEQCSICRDRLSANLQQQKVKFRREERRSHRQGTIPSVGLKFLGCR